VKRVFVVEALQCRECRRIAEHVGARKGRRLLHLEYRQREQVVEQTPSDVVTFALLANLEVRLRTGMLPSVQVSTSSHLRDVTRVNAIILDWVRFVAVTPRAISDTLENARDIALQELYLQPAPNWC
jgi:hypothetical protein